MASENIMMSAVKKGGDRQQLTKAPGSLSGSGKNVKELGMDNDLIDRICSDESFQLDREEIQAILKPINFVGRSVEQVEVHLSGGSSCAEKKYREVLGERAS